MGTQAKPPNDARSIQAQQKLYQLFYHADEESKRQSTSSRISNFIESSNDTVFGRDFLDFHNFLRLSNAQQNVKP